MEVSRPSRTALRVALRRAAHQIHDSPIVFDDPVAVQILGESYREELRRTPVRQDRPFSVSLRAFLVARSRFAEETLAAGIADGVSQYVVLGAGLDTFGVRNSIPGLRVFEVDHPATQVWKRELLESSKLPVPDSLTFVAVDFEVDALAEQLDKAGFAWGRKSVFAWLGVVPYLSLAAFRKTLGILSRAPAGSGVVLDYSQPREVLPPLERLAHDSLAARVRLAGEPFQLFFTPEEMRRELSGFCRVNDLGSTELNALYFARRQDLLMTRGKAGRLLRAWR